MFRFGVAVLLGGAVVLATGKLIVAVNVRLAARRLAG